jgi:hypothetical protein
MPRQEKWSRVATGTIPLSAILWTQESWILFQVWASIPRKPLLIITHSTSGEVTTLTILPAAISAGSHHARIRCIEYGKDKNILITGGTDGVCRVWVVDHPNMAAALSEELTTNGT